MNNLKYNGFVKNKLSSESIINCKAVVTESSNRFTWSDANNWDNGIPANGDDVIIDNFGPPVLDNSVLETDFNSLEVKMFSVLSVAENGALTVQTPIVVATLGELHFLENTTITASIVSQGIVKGANTKIIGNVTNTGGVIDAGNKLILIDGDFSSTGANTGQISVMGKTEGCPTCKQVEIPAVPISPWSIILSIFFIMIFSIIKLRK